jgi:hypothetical protein
MGIATHGNTVLQAVKSGIETRMEDAKCGTAEKFGLPTIPSKHDVRGYRPKLRWRERVFA